MNGGEVLHLPHKEMGETLGNDEFSRGELKTFTYSQLIICNASSYISSISFILQPKAPSPHTGPIMLHSLLVFSCF